MTISQNKFKTGEENRPQVLSDVAHSKGRPNTGYCKGKKTFSPTRLSSRLPSKYSSTSPGKVSQELTGLPTNSETIKM